MKLRTYSLLPLSLLLCLLLSSACSRHTDSTGRAQAADLPPTAVWGPLVPTPAPGAEAKTTHNSDISLADDPLLNSNSENAPLQLPAPYSLPWRTGVGIPDGGIPTSFQWPDPRPGWYLNWSTGLEETEPAEGPSPAAVAGGLPFTTPPDADVGMEFMPMINVPQGKLNLTPAWITAVARAHPGHTWLIGNEPDVRWQDNATPAQYATAYHDAYTAIKAGDPTAQVAIAGLSQITPLRLEYLDQVWAAYQDHYGEPMPVDVWTMHAFVLQEKADDWGVDLPPGLEDRGQGELWTVEQHDDLDLVEAQIRRMRAWMADHGQQDKPLWITEYGILMPPEYGFDEERVRRFLINSFDRFNNLTDPELGLAADAEPDGPRLVQRWLWYSTDDYRYPTGNLFTPDGAPTTAMRVYHAYLENFTDPPPECSCGDKE